MKLRFFTMLLLMVGFALNSYATNPISPEAIDFEKTMKVEKMNKVTKLLAKFSQTKVGKWVTKKASVVAKVAQKFGIDLQDPVQKWLWYAIIAFILSAVLWTVGWSVFTGGLWRVFSLMSSLLGLAAVICFWYWVYLKFLA